MAVSGVKEEAGAVELPQQPCLTSVCTAVCVDAAVCLWSTHFPMHVC